MELPQAKKFLAKTELEIPAADPEFFNTTRDENLPNSD